MSFRSVAERNVVLRMAVVMTLAGAILVSVSLTNKFPTQAQSPRSAALATFHLPNEAAGFSEIVQTLLSVFDQTDVVALGEAHRRKPDSDLRIALVRHPDFARKVRFIEVEFASTTEQATLDRYIRGENVSTAQLAQVWKTTTQANNGIWDDPSYADFFAAVREVNSKLPAEAQIRVLGGDPGPGDNRSRETAAVEVLREQALQQHGKVLVIYGAGHFYRAWTDDYLSSAGSEIGIVRMLEAYDPGRIFAVIPLGYELRLPPAVNVPEPDFQKFDRAIKTQVRPVLVSLQRLPFRDFTASEFLGRTLINCLPPRGCRSVFQDSTLKLGQMADAVVYFGADVDSKGKPAR